MLSQSEHIVSGYDADLASIQRDLSDLGTVVSEMTTDAMKAFKKRNSEAAKTVIARDEEANQLQQKIDEAVLRLIALRNPVAQDLRRIVGAIRIASDLERIGDLAEGIARRALTINAEKQVDIGKSVYRMGKQVRLQLSGALDTLMNEDSQAALHFWQADADIDDLYNSLFSELISVMMGEPRTIPACAELLFVAKNLERIGDHATNICESVYFTVEASPLIDDPKLPDLIRESGGTETR